MHFIKLITGIDELYITHAHIKKDNKEIEAVHIQVKIYKYQLSGAKYLFDDAYTININGSR